jgi:nucleoside-triphosphatase THEP1
MARWALLVGPKGSGKSNSALEIVERVRAHGLRVEGFVQVGWTDDLERKGHDLHSLRDGERVQLSRPGSEEKAGEEAFCSFVFNQAAFGVARSWIFRDAPGADVVVVDEVSKLEAAGKGHHDGLCWVMGRADVKVVLTCVRADQLFYVMEKFKLEEEPFAMIEVPADGASIEAFALEIVGACCEVGMTAWDIS